MLLLNTATAQNVTIDYQTWNPSSPPCNIFGTAINVPAIVNGTNSTIEHQSLIGQPQLNASPKEIRLACQYVSASSSLGTKYRIDYDFKVGYKYYITVNAAQLNSTTGYSTGVYLRLDMTNTGGGGGTCVGAQTISPNYSGNPAPFQFSAASFNDRPFPYSSPLTANYSTLEISALLAAVSGSNNTIRIRKITIEETAPDVSFTLAPAALAIACGSSTAQTFTVTNVHSTPGVTAHNWDLGSANNGWLYNGSAAPQYISTGTTNTLTLTPVCGFVQQSVNVSVTANGNAYPANASVVSVTIPTFTIQGSQTLCSGTQSYSIPDLPCNATVSWQSSNTNIATITASGNPATLTRVNNSNGVVTITATVTACGSNQAVPYHVGVGKAQPGSVNILLFDPYMGKILAEIDPVPGASSYKWYKNGVVQPGRVGTFANIGISETPCNINYNIAVEAVSVCGTSAASSTNVFYSCDYLFTISPNPAQSMVSVSVKETQKIQDGSGVIDEIRIYDSYGGLQKRLQHFGTKRAHFNISGIPSGRYLIEIRSGKYKEYQQLIIQK